MSKNAIEQQADTLIQIQEAISKFPINNKVLAYLEARILKDETIGELHVLDEKQVIIWLVNLRKLLSLNGVQ